MMLVPSLASLAAAVCACAFLAGCETVSSETSDGRPMPPAVRKAQRAPDDAPINALSLTFEPKPGDSDGNNRPDQITLTLYLFARPYPAPTWRDGQFVVSAYRSGTAGSPSTPGTKPFHVWTIETRDLNLGRFRNLIGDGYRFQLSLLDQGGTDRIDGNSLDFTVCFRPASGGAPVWSDGARAMVFEPMRVGESR